MIEQLKSIEIWVSRAPLCVGSNGTPCDAGMEVRLPDLIIGHGVLGRMLARLTLAAGGEPPTVWEIDEARRDGAVGYEVVHPDIDNEIITRYF